MIRDQQPTAFRYTRRALMCQGLLAAWGVSSLAACSNGMSDSTPHAKAEETRSTSTVIANPAITNALLAANLDFGFRLQDVLLKSSSAENLFFSPLSISTALDMVYNGATGTTRQAMATALGLKALSQTDVNAAMLNILNGLCERDPKITLSIADSIWLRKGLVAVPSFITALQTYYSAVLYNLDFSNPQAPDTINTWVKKQTHGLIPSIVKNIDQAALMYLINALYFKAPWRVPFSTGDTQPGEFTTSAGKTITIPMMSKESSFLYARSETTEMIQLPYGAGKMSMYIVLPAENSSLKALLSSLDATHWNTLLKTLTQRHGTIQLPKFAVTYEVGLKDALTALGMGLAFDPHKATFPGMIKGQHVCISEVKHKATMKVDEYGTLAAAVTSVVMVGAALSQDNFNMVVNRPFFCAIRDDVTGTLLFVGVIIDPSQQR
jgi:serpin B